MPSQEQRRQPYRDNKDSADRTDPPAVVGYQIDWSRSWPAGTNGGIAPPPE